jgi:hypothetical protein
MTWKPSTKVQVRRFYARQQRAKRWLNFAWIAEALAREHGGLKADESARFAAFEELYVAVLRGEFELSGKSFLLFLSGDFSSNGFWTKEELATAVRVSGGKIDRWAARDILSCCWGPSSLARKWFVTRNLRLPPHLFPDRSSEQSAEDVAREPPPPPNKAVSWTIKAERNIETYLTKLMKGRPNEPIPKTKVRQMLSAAGLPPNSDRGFERAWMVAVRNSKAVAWSKPGRRKRCG